MLLCRLFNVVKGWSIWSVYMSEDQKASLFLVALQVTLYVFSLLFFLKAKIYLF